MKRQHLSKTQNAIIAPHQPENQRDRSSPHPIEELQGAIGNQAVNRLLANQPTVQAKPMFRGLSRELAIQPKLTIGAVGDKYEQEADRVAASVVRKINAPQNSAIQREEMPEDEELQMKPMVQCLGEGNSIAAPPNLESSINQAKGSGQSIPNAIRQPMENALGTDFSGVKVHTDDRANRLNESIQATAFTTGKDIFFKHGEYNPGNRKKQELLAHELTHVVQQNGNAVQRFQPLRRQITNLMSEEGEELQPEYGVFSREQSFFKRGEGCIQRGGNKDKIKNYKGSTIGVEIEYPVPFSIVLSSKLFRGVIAKVKSAGGTVLAEMTTDMGNNPYTIENRTTPVEESNYEHIKVRKDALELLDKAISLAGKDGKILEHKGSDQSKFDNCTGKPINFVEEDDTGKPINPLEKDDMEIKVIIENHKIIENKDKTPGLQITRGLSWQDMLEEVGSKQGFLSLANPAWLKYYNKYLKYLQENPLEEKQEEKQEEQQEENIQNVDPKAADKIFAMLASFLEFYLDRIDFREKMKHNEQLIFKKLKKSNPNNNQIEEKGEGEGGFKNNVDQIEEEGKGGKGVKNNQLNLLNTVDPTEKNAWILLPKTRPNEWLSGLGLTEQKRVKEELQKIPSREPINKKAWQAAFDFFIKEKNDIGGHQVPNFTINGQKGFAFEIRHPEPDQKYW